jgi:hypothetical protein
MNPPVGVRNSKLRGASSSFYYYMIINERNQSPNFSHKEAQKAQKRSAEFHFELFVLLCGIHG